MDEKIIQIENENEISVFEISKESIKNNDEIINLINQYKPKRCIFKEEDLNFFKKSEGLLHY
jgi:hypothetical protein